MSKTKQILPDSLFLVIASLALLLPVSAIGEQHASTTTLQNLQMLLPQKQRTSKEKSLVLTNYVKTRSITSIGFTMYEGTPRNQLQVRGGVSRISKKASVGVEIRLHW